MPRKRLWIIVALKLATLTLLILRELRRLLHET